MTVHTCTSYSVSNGLTNIHKEILYIYYILFVDDIKKKGLGRIRFVEI